ncbi:universal stress protein [Ramlibacter humi]|uniref:Universal stress protein n=1 Tax=Ramlibacter humi TaxID=2530451 RepID=A0A4Z0CBM7_9BURK|nr:universal stress protein [Ramlibacter humi]TFZ07828.1 universal stress protein [Ramlibacter humi]
MYERILVTTDGSELSRKAVIEAIALCRKLGAELYLLHVVPRYPMSYFEGGSALEAGEVSRIEKQWADHGRTIVDQAAKQAEESGLVARAVVMQSDAVADSIIAAARKHRCSLIVMASHGRRGLQRVLLGSETQHVLTQSEIPVLVLR